MPPWPVCRPLRSQSGIVAVPGKNRARPFLRCDMGRDGDQPPAMPTQNCAVCGARRPRRATVPRFDLVILRPQAEESAFPSPNAPSSVICSANATFPPEGGRFYQARLGSRPSHHTQMLPVENPVENVQTFVRRETGPENGTGKIYKFVISCGPDLL